MSDRLEELREHTGLPGFFAGSAVFITGNAITEYTNTNPDVPTLHETLGLGLSGLAAIGTLALVGEIRRRRARNAAAGPLTLSQNVDGSGGHQHDGQ